MYNLRNASLADVPYLTTTVGKDMCILLDDASVYDEEQMASVLRNIIGHIVVVEEGVEIVGAMGAMLTPMLWNPTMQVFTEVFWWVREDKRNGRIGAMLLKWFEEAGKQAGATRLVMSILPSTNAQLERRGYVCRESVVVKEI